MKRFAVLTIALASLAAVADAGAFFGWRVAGVVSPDTLNVRAYPTSSSRIQVAYPNGTRLSMTGRCTGGLHMDQRWFARLSWSGKRAAVRSRWCELWHDYNQDGDYETGWVYGKYIAPL